MHALETANKKGLRTDLLQGGECIFSFLIII